MGSYVLDLRDIDRTQVAIAGGKGANLGELSGIEGIRVPPGFCVTTLAFERIIADASAIDDQIDRLSRLAPDDRDAIRAQSAEIRRTIEAIPLPADLAAAVTASLARLGEHAACAVRSSSTAEDLPTASFAGQHDSFLNIVGPAAVLQHISRCWASLFTERAVTCRLRNGVDHRKVRMAVVVQQMVEAEAAGILFTADPITGNRKTARVEATAGLGEALVSGMVNADTYTVRDGDIVAKEERQTQRSLTDPQVIRLVELGRRIEAHFGSPQDIEWCRVDEDFQIVQSRPITTLFPIPETVDGENRVYISVGHQQMMTDALKPLGLSVWQMTTPRPMAEAGGRLFVDVTEAIASPASRAALLKLTDRSDPRVGDALQTVLDRGDFIRMRAEDDSGVASPPAQAPLETDPAVVAELIASSEASIAAMKREIDTTSGAPLLDFIREDIQELRRILFHPLSHQAIMAGMEAAWWLNDQLEAWLGERNAADALTQSVPHNITSEMGLALLDVADVIRPHPDVVEFLHSADDESFLNELPRLAGGREARDAILAWLDRYGMRGVGEIDITRPRWSERPSTLLSLLLGNISNAEPGAAARRFAQGREDAERKEQELLARLRELPDGAHKAEATKRMIDRVRTFAGYREYPKYGKISREFIYKQALMKEAERLVEAGVLREAEDIFYLRFEELATVARTHRIDDGLIRQRKEAFRSCQALRPPRVLTSDGEMLSGAYRRDAVPAGALVGLGASGGTVEGRARVILDMAGAELEPGDILVTTYTDPSWTPLFVAIAGLVTEVGGLMTHGAVIAREYGLPAVVGVDRATRMIRDGQRIRVHGTDGYVEILA